MYILKRWVWPVVAGFVVASITMLVFEWINHYIFPLPAGLDTNNPAAVWAFTATLPWTAYILVFVGWAFGAFEAGCTTAWISQDSTKSGTDASRAQRVVRAGENQFRATVILAILLVIAGIADMFAIGFPTIAMILGVAILAVSPFLGRIALNTFEKNKRA